MYAASTKLSELCSTSTASTLTLCNRYNHIMQITYKTNLDLAISSTIRPKELTHHDRGNIFVTAAVAVKEI
ncbi:unnamed protein product [Acanthoscelides obtectus]|uniref:Uncharacterized protein n=1 Tax=Acanthoscelides obtectus TaxID=200917 RepID=A0A9P0P167_ACAOB|nr:unnamed protein product [Acanthoscelides obtectus]CAK1667437.1 hypothetical protein AOBTE_LOCUS25843 [Acanthoscelides obtectus]